MTTKKIDGFMKYERNEPQRRPVADRIQDSKEMYLPVSDETLQNQSSRCMDCGVPFCQSEPGCPVENLIPEWNESVSQSRYKDALVQLHSTNNFPEFTGRLCPAPCESACVLGINSDPVSIRMIEWNIIDKGFENGWVEPVIATCRTNNRVAVVGSGPAGLAAAQQLARAGHSVTVFEKNDRIGGLLRYGIPDFKMEKNLVDRRIEQMRIEGVEFKTSIEVGVTLTSDELKKNFDAICLTIGAEAPRDLKVPGRDLNGIHFAMDFLINANRAIAGLSPLKPELSAQGKTVVVIGGGDTGSDCIGTAHRQGAKKIHQIEVLAMPPLLRSKSTPWPSWPLKMRSSHAHEEGCERHWSKTTTRFAGSQNQVSAVEGSDFRIDADMVILAMGFVGHSPNPLLQALGVQSDSNRIVTKPLSYQTSVLGVFAAGDTKRGASLIVWAIAEGRKMAAEVDRFLGHL